MPTENRSSNTEMVSVPREHELKIRQTPLADLLSGLKTGEIRDCSDREFAVGDTVLLREIDDAREYTGTVLRRTITHVQKNYGLPDHLCVLSYGQPAEQHQGERARLGDGDLIRMANKAAPHHDRDNDMFYIAMGRLVEAHYTHADPGEAERLTRKAANADLALAAQTRQVHSLRAQLAERDALLREVEPTWRNGTLSDVTGLCIRIDAALSASAEPSAPVERDERAEFESALRSIASIPGDSINYHATHMSRIARAALERKP